MQKSKKNSNSNQASRNGNGNVKTSLAPAAISSTVTTTVPRVQQTRDGVLVSHKELLRAIPGSTSFSATSFSLNPGLATTFEWLWKEALNYESYSLQGNFIVRYESRKSSSTNGIVVLAIDFDASDAAPVNLQQVMAYRGAVRSNVWVPFSLTANQAECNKLPQRYVRSGTVSSTDIKTYDFGNLFVCTDGCADTSLLGEVYLEYSFHLRTPQSSPLGLYSALSAKIVAGGTVSKTAYLGTSAVISGGLSVTALTNTITFGQTGQFLVVLNEGGTVFTGVAPTASGTATSVALIGVITDAAATSAVSIFSVNVLEVGQTFILDWSAVCTTLTSGNARISTYATTLG